MAEQGTKVLLHNPTHEHPDELPGHVRSEMLTHHARPSERSSSAYGTAVAEHQADVHSSGAVADFGHVGEHEHDGVVVANAHPHQEHSVGYHTPTDDPRKEHYESYGFPSVHILHASREKNPEHHSPQGLMDTHPNV